MADISYNPVFHHTPWKDNFDRVQAEGSTGFNTRFQTIESDLHGVSTVVAQISAAIKPPSPFTVTFAPTVLPVSGQTAWVPSGTASIGAAAGASAIGVLPVTFPNGAQITAVKIIGTGTDSGSTHTSFAFTRVSVTGGANLATTFDVTTVPLNTAAPLPNPAVGLIDLANFRYTFTASTGPAAAGTPISLVAFQFTYTQ